MQRKETQQSEGHLLKVGVRWGKQQVVAIDRQLQNSNLNQPKKRGKTKRRGKKEAKKKKKKGRAVTKCFRRMCETKLLRRREYEAATRH